ncbi:MAG: hypothetical protein F4Y45_14165 [Acidobacteria bacterium]|nr:hypothetical protein [Acidobacteriota bacterium]
MIAPRDVGAAGEGKSIVDYIFRWMASKLLSAEAQHAAGVNVTSAAEGQDGEQLSFTDAPAVNGCRDAPATASGGPAPEAPSTATNFAIQNDQDAPSCATCGAIMIRNGACYKCINCGATSGCA